jgi:secreted trypsin-like serine protease
MIRPTPTFLTNVLIASSCIFLSACSSDSDDSSSSGSGGSACAEIGYSKTAKIVNGDQGPITSANDSSSIAQLEILSGGSPAGICTGTVISPTAILTAAHCFIGSDRAANVITTTNGSQQRVRSRSVSIHPEFTVNRDSVMINDVAVIRTASRMSAPSTPILLRRDAQAGEEAVVAGYGQTSSSAPTTDDVYAGYAIVRSVTENHIRIDFQSDESHPCRGDSGGALLVEEGGLAIAGVVSQSDPSVPADTICEVGDKTLYTSMQNASVSSFVLSVAPDAAVR